MNEYPAPGHIWSDTSRGPMRRTILLVSKAPYWNALITYPDNHVEFADFDVEDVERWYWTKQLPEMKRLI